MIEFSGPGTWQAFCWYLARVGNIFLSISVLTYHWKQVDIYTHDFRGSRIRLSSKLIKIKIFELSAAPVVWGLWIRLVDIVLVLDVAAQYWMRSKHFTYTSQVEWAMSLRHNLKIERFCWCLPDNSLLNYYSVLKHQVHSKDNNFYTWVVSSCWKRRQILLS